MKTNNNSKTKYSDQEIKTHISFLEKLINDSEQFANLSDEQRIALMTAAGKLSRPHRDEIKKRNYQLKQKKRQLVKTKERAVRADTGIRRAREKAVFTAPLKITDATANSTHDEFELKSPRNCYV